MEMGIVPFFCAKDEVGKQSKISHQTFNANMWPAISHLVFSE